MLYRPLEADRRPILRIPRLDAALPEDYRGDLAVDIEDLLKRTVTAEDLEGLRRRACIDSVLIWFPALARPQISQMAYWQSIGFSGVLLADFDDDGFRMLCCPDRFFAGIVFVERYAALPHRVKLAAEILNREYGRELLMVLDHDAPQSTKALTHVRDTWAGAVN